MGTDAAVGRWYGDRVDRSSAASGYDARAFDALAAAEDRSFWFRTRNRLIVDAVSARAKPGDSFLEIGCGTGYVLRALTREAELRVTGAELFEEGLRFARERVPEADLVQLDAREMPYHAAFDAAGAFDVLEHIDDDAGALRGLHTALKPGGWLFVTVPQHAWLWSAADDHARHVRRYSRRMLVERLVAARFSLKRVTSFVSALLPLMAASRWRQRRSSRPYDPTAELSLPPALDRALERALDAERKLIARGMNLPAGGSLLAVARR